MPNKHFYFAMGASVGVVATVVLLKSRHWLYENKKWMRKLYRADRNWPVYFPVIIAFFGLTALTPDIIHALNILPKSATRTSLFNIFYGHTYFEWLEDANPKIDWYLNTLGSIVLFLVAIGILLHYIFIIKKIMRSSANA